MYKKISGFKNGISSINIFCDIFLKVLNNDKLFVSAYHDIFIFHVGNCIKLLELPFTEKIPEITFSIFGDYFVIATLDSTISFYY